MVVPWRAKNASQKAIDRRDKKRERRQAREQIMSDQREPWFEKDPKNDQYVALLEETYPGFKCKKCGCGFNAPEKFVPYECQACGFKGETDAN